MKKGANVAVKAVMEPTMKVTIGLPTADWIAQSGEWVVARFGSFTLFACPTSTAPGNRNETNFSFLNWLLPTKSQSEANLNWTAKRLPGVFSRDF